MDERRGLNAEMLRERSALRKNERRKRREGVRIYAVGVAVEVRM
jgi:hypothetical protein